MFSPRILLPPPPPPLALALVALLAIGGLSCSQTEAPVVEDRGQEADPGADGSDSTGGTDGTGETGGTTDGGATGGGDDGTPVVPGDDDCLTTRQFFAQEVWAPLMGTTCVACHNPAGAARHTKLILRTESWPGWLDANLETLREVAAFEVDGTSILLLKPTLQLPHEGGEVVTVDSEHYAALEELIERLSQPEECEETPVDQTGFFAGVTQLDAAQTFRKAALSVAGRLPTVEERTFLEVNGEAGLDPLMDALLHEEGFYERLREWWNDLLLTDRYDRNKDALNLLHADDYPDRRWMDDEDYEVSASERALGQAHANRGVARAGLELIAWVVRHGLPFTEVLTADYVVLDPLSARSYGVHADVPWVNPADPDEQHEVQLPGIPHAGLLTEAMVLNRFPTTATNRNRHRSRTVWRLFLGTDVLALAEQPIDPTSIEDHNPTLFNPACTVCHEVIDPLAGAFQNWDDRGRYLPPEEGWFSDMLPPGFEEEAIPYEDQFSSLQWAAQRIAQDSRFSTAIVQMVYTAMTGQAPLKAPSQLDESIQTDEDMAARVAAWDAQQAQIAQIADDFVASDYDFRQVVKGIAMSPWYRAADVDAEVAEARAAELAPVGTARLLDPEQLNRKIEAATGYPWRNQPHHTDYLLDVNQYRIFYGGIDSNQVISRITTPSGVMVAVQLRMANEMACRVTPQDFAKLPWERKLFPLVETTYQPLDDNGFPIPQAEEAIRENIRHLHARLLGERLQHGDPELEATWELWRDTWADGKAAVAAGEEDDDLHWACRASTDWATGQEAPEGYAVTKDANYTVRAWRAVITYLLSDYRFTYE